MKFVLVTSFEREGVTDPRVEMARVLRKIAHQIEETEDMSGSLDDPADGHWDWLHRET